MANSTFSFAKAISLTDYMPAFRTKEQMQSWDWGKVSTKKTTKRATEQVFSYVGLPAARQTKELDTIYYANMAELDSTTFTVNKFTLATMFSHELIEDNQHLPDVMAEAGSAMGESHAFIRDQAVAAIFNRAFSSTNQAMYDGSALCATHTMHDGTSYDNALTAASITFDNVWSAVNHFETSLVSHAGLYLRDVPKYLIYHPSKEKEVRAILRSTNGEPGTADNDANTLLDYNLVPVPCRFLTTSTNWFIAGSRFKNDLLYFSRENVKKAMEDDFDRMGVKIRTYQRFAVGVREFVYLVGNPGA
jgi:hypothetical protein